MPHMIPSRGLTCSCKCLQTVRCKPNNTNKFQQRNKKIKINIINIFFSFLESSNNNFIDNKCCVNIPGFLFGKVTLQFRLDPQMVESLWRFSMCVFPQCCSRAEESPRTWVIASQYTIVSNLIFHFLWLYAINFYAIFFTSSGTFPHAVCPSFFSRNNSCHI